MNARHPQQHQVVVRDFREGHRTVATSAFKNHLLSLFAFVYGFVLHIEELSVFGLSLHHSQHFAEGRIEALVPDFLGEHFFGGVGHLMGDRDIRQQVDYFHGLDGHCFSLELSGSC